MTPPLHVIEWPGPGRLATMAHPRGGDWLDDEMSALAGAGVNVLVSALTAEESERLLLTREPAAATAAGLEFVAFPIADRGVPPTSSTAVELADRLAGKVRAGEFVVAHCFAAIGRATLVAGATLVMLGVGADEALRLVSEARGLAVPDTPLQRSWLQEFAATAHR